MSLESDREARKRYIKYKTKSICLTYKTEDYIELKSIIGKSGLPTNTFIKQAIREKIEREKLDKK